MKTIEDIETIEGFDAVATYGLCSCEAGHISSQKWLILRRSKFGRNREQHMTSVECGNCGAPPGARSVE